MIGFCSSARFTEHQTGPGHPERADRIRAIYRGLIEAGLLDGPGPFPDFQLDVGAIARRPGKLVSIEPEPAEVRWLLTVHSPHHVEHVRRFCESGGGVIDAQDTVVGPESYEIAMLALGGVLRSCDAVMTGKVQRAFAAIRPPGHHAEAGRAMGFCLFSNIAIAARYLQRTYGIERVAVVDFDVHHCNGTQAIFEDDPSVYVISLHESPRTCYPGTGFAWEIGTGRGRGYTLNLPFDAGARDADYVRTVDARVVPELDEFRPQVLLISAGFDGHRDDPLASLNLTEEGFELMTRSLAAVADRHCEGRIVSVLEGGYDLRALARSVVHHLIGLGA